MPVVSPEHVRAPLAALGRPLLDLTECLAGYTLLDRLSLAVQPLTLRRELLRLFARCRKQELQRDFGMTEPTRRVDAGGEAKPDRAGIDDCRVDLSRAHERLQPWPRSAGQSLETGGSERAILVDKRYHIGDGGQCYEVEHRVERLVLCESLHELVGDAGAAQLREGIARRARRDDRTLGQLLGRSMVVGDDHLETAFTRVCDLVDGSDAAVDRQENLDTVFDERVNGFAPEPVALFEAAWQEPAHVGAPVSEHGVRERGGADAVDVVIAVNADARALFDRGAQNRQRSVDIAEAGDVVRKRACLERACPQGTGPRETDRSGPAARERWPWSGRGRAPELAARPLTASSPRGTTVASCTHLTNRTGRADSRCAHTVDRSKSVSIL